MGCLGSKHSVLETVDDSVHVMISRDKKTHQKQGDAPRGYVPRAPHPLLQQQQQQPVGADGAAAAPKQLPIIASEEDDDHTGTTNHNTKEEAAATDKPESTGTDNTHSTTQSQ